MSALYRAAVKATKKGHAHNARPDDNPYSPSSWVVTIGSVDVLFFRNDSAHIKHETMATDVTLWPWRLRRALRKQGIVAPTTTAGITPERFFDEVPS